MLVPTFLLLSVLGLLSQTSAQAVDAWHLDTMYTLITQRLDPIINPNGVSSHVHRILGGSNFGANYNYPLYDGSSCSSAAVQADNSNYWMPQLFWRENGKFTPLKAGTRFYYFLARNKPNEPVKAFPPGLRIVIGNPNAKNSASTGIPVPAQGFICLKDHFSSPTGDRAGPDFNFATDCPQGLTTTIKFPPCWDGKNLYKPDGSHMAYTDNLQYGSCPVSHPIRLPAIMLEYVWQTYKLRPGVALKDHLVWANGDTTGYGLHADFVNGWDTDVLNAALTSPDCVGKGEMTMTACTVLAQHMNNAAALACKPSRGVLETIEDGVALDALPGCNIPWSSGTKPTCSPPVTNPTLPSSLMGQDGSVTYTGSEYPIPSLADYPANKWSRMGCIGGQASLLNSIQYTDSALTPARCQAYCWEWGMPYSGLISGSYCQCGTGIHPGAFAWPDAHCPQKCSGAAGSTCGGNGKLELFYNPSSTTVHHPGIADPQYIGCRRDGTGGRVLSASYISYGPMTIEWCKNYCTAQKQTLAGLEFGHVCMCGNSFANGGGVPQPQEYCALACEGNTKQICGGPAATVSIYNISLAGGGGSSSGGTSVITSTKSSTSAPVGSGGVTITKTVTVTAACTAGRKKRSLRAFDFLH
ncbi:hypothetical protein CI109_101191 [Kwoniella shandongensis]|uniref:Uncharacterized protein n=1 Tax=Kwoniella shandongensis TaxID=1734106 RepID=A0A5M6BU13_9TREE|nr:uncharacterized protein CI109_005491 [Kwoniella shandongensis]KAA5526213.1 hypothetical protein CI109_005491 [Kwoniella shandongensis]